MRLLYARDEMLQELFGELAKEIDGKIIGNASINTYAVIKDDFIFHYRPPARDTIAVFSVMTPMPLPQKTSICIDKYNKISLVKRYYKNDWFDVVVETDDEFGKKLVDGLLADYEFMAQFKNLFNDDFKIYISDDSICVFEYNTVDAIFSPMTKEKLIAMLQIAKEFKTAIQYYIKRYNPQ